MAHDMADPRPISGNSASLDSRITREPGAAPKKGGALCEILDPGRLWCRTIAMRQELLWPWFHASGPSVCILLTDDDGTVAAEGTRKPKEYPQSGDSVQNRVPLLKLPGFFDCLRILCNMAAQHQLPLLLCTM